jgi:hypothetical protein
MTSSSRVRHLPPALVILARAASVNLKAATFNLGQSRTLSSSVMVPMQTAILPWLAPRCFCTLEMESGGRMVLEARSLLRMVAVNLEPVLRARKRNNYSKILALQKALSTYLHEQVLVKILAFRVCLVLFLESASVG